MKELIKELFAQDELHELYLDNEYSYTIDSIKEGNTITIKVTFNENKDKKEFEDWVQTIDDSLFQEAIEVLGENFISKYNTEQYKEVINKFKETIKSLAQSKLKILQDKTNALKKLI